MRKPGCIEPVIYWQHPDGHLTLAPFSSAPTPEDCNRYEADTLAAVDTLCARLCQQEHEAAEREMRQDMNFREPREKAIRDRLYQRMTSGSTTEYEREFIKLYMQLRDERKRETYRQRYKEYSWYLHAREHDLGSRRADEESVNVEKINF